MVQPTVGIVLTALVASGLAHADFRIQDWRFDTDQPGQPPAGFVHGSGGSGGGRWEVKADPKSSSPPNVLAHIPLDRSGKLPEVLFIDKAEAMNLEMSVWINAVEGGEGVGSGVVFRADDERNYYVIWLSPNENLVRLDKVVNGRPETLQDLQVEAEPGKWHVLRVSIRGPIYEAFLNNRFLSAREDAWEFGRYKKGKVGLWTRGASVSYFDDLRITPTDGGTGSTPLGGTETTIIKK